MAITALRFVAWLRVILLPSKLDVIRDPTMYIYVYVYICTSGGKNLPSVFHPRSLTVSSLVNRCEA